jgi:membrane-bound lytic murein transglycosylase A
MGGLPVGSPLGCRPHRIVPLSVSMHHSDGHGKNSGASTLAARPTVGLVTALFVAACSSTPHRRPEPIIEPPPRTVEHKPGRAAQPPKPRTAVEIGVSAGPPVSSLDLSADSASAALASFKASCRALLHRADVSGLTRPADWQPACVTAAQPDTDPVAFFQRQFETVLVGNGELFATGYYEPEIEGSRTHDPGYDTPIYSRPPDLVEVDPGVASGGAPTGRKQRGRMKDGRLLPYYERAEINNGALAGQGLEIAWAQDPVEFFFLQIQGSGRLHLPDGSIMRIGYNGQNGRDYVAVGRLLHDRALIGPGTGYDLSMQGVMGWLRDHPDQGKSIMEEDKSYVFFKELNGVGPLGALGAPVVGHVSVAADPAFIPLGAPVWLSASDRPEVTGLWVAQDTGGAIKGANRFDTFWGAGVLARITAGGMSAHGQALILVPRGTVARLTELAANGGAAPQR